MTMLRQARLGVIFGSGALAHPLRAATHRLGGGGEVDVSLGRIIIAFIICIIIAVLAILLIRQRGGKMNLARLFATLEPRARAIEVVETRKLNPGSDVCLVRHGGREYLLVLQQGATHVLRERDVPIGHPLA